MNGGVENAPCYPGVRDRWRLRWEEPGQRGNEGTMAGWINDCGQPTRHVSTGHTLDEAITDSPETSRCC
jgi:hypothetical protein